MEPGLSEGEGVAQSQAERYEEEGNVFPRTYVGWYMYLVAAWMVDLGA